MVQQLSESTYYEESNTYVRVAVNLYVITVELRSRAQHFPPHLHSEGPR